MLNFDNRYRFALSYKAEYREISNPIDWKSKTLEYSRNANLHGIFSTISDSISFINEDAEFISNIYDNGKINENIRFIIYKLDDITDDEQVYFEGTLDLSEYMKEKDVVSVKLNSSGILTQYKARQNDKYEITRSNALDGRELAPLTTKQVYLHGRKIFLLSIDKGRSREQFVEAIPDDASTNNYLVYRHDRPERLKAGAVNDMIVQGDTLFHSILQEGDNVTYNTGSHTYTLEPSNPTSSQMFYTNDDVEKTIRVRLRKEQTFHLIDGWADGVHIKLNLYKYDNGTLYENETLVHEYSSILLTDATDESISIDDARNVTLLANQSLSLVYELYYVSDGSTFKYTHKIESTTEEDTLTVEWDSIYDGSFTQAYTLHDIGTQLATIIGDYGFKSNLLGRTDLGYVNNGELSNMLVAHGLFIRKFDKEDKEFKPLTTSLKQFFNSIDTIANIGISIERTNGKQTIRCEERSYYYQPTTVIDFGEAFNIKETVAGDVFFSTIEVGYKKPKGELYEENLGLDEYNTSTEYATIINRINKKKQILSDYRADSYGIEFARRQGIDKAPTKDTRYDKEVFFLDSRKTGTYYSLKKWYYDYSELPTGVYSPETAYNLNITPARILHKHANHIKAGLRGYPNSYIRYINSEANSNLSTTSHYVETVKENADIHLQELNHALHTAREVEFECVITDAIRKQIEGNTDDVPNVYFKARFTDNGEIKEGYIQTIKLNSNTVKLTLV